MGKNKESNLNIITIVKSILNKNTKINGFADLMHDSILGGSFDFFKHLQFMRKESTILEIL